MADLNKAPEKEIKVEDLLRLKRSERPSEAFWGTFDRELHQRMLQALVKKDPWYLQLLHAASGRIAQTTAVGAAAAFLAMIMLRPALLETSQPVRISSLSQQGQGQGAELSKLDFSSNAPVEVAMSDLDVRFTSDYRIEAISSPSSVNLGYTQDFVHDSFQVAAYEGADYTTDTASFVGTGLATALVY